MPSSAAEFLSNSHTDPAHLEAPEKLIDALRKYQSDADLENLRCAYKRYLARREALKKPPSLARAIRRGFLSFNIAPSNSYERYMAAAKERNDACAIRADWDAAGEYLSYALIKHILDPHVFEEEKNK